MHVGHLRSSIIENRFSGSSVQTAGRSRAMCILGDWGLPMGQLIAELAVRRPDLPYFDPADRSPYPKKSPVSMDDLEEMYPAAAAACKADPKRLEAARLATAELQAGRPGYRALWQHFHDVSAVGASSANSQAWASCSTSGKANPTPIR